MLLKATTDRVKVTRFTKSEIQVPKYVTKCSFKNFNEEEFLEDLRKESWYEICMSDVPNVASYLLEEKISKHLDKLAPVTTIQIRKNYVSWLTKELKLLMKERDNAIDLANYSNDPIDKLHYKILESQLQA